MYRKIIYLTLTLLFVISVPTSAQRKNAKYVAYIDKYSDMAVEQMKLHKIPASITLAQGILESAAGQSRLTRDSNNHFGIKCGSGWKGSSVRHDDDAKNECFRAYKSARDSYEDHSKLLVNVSRYGFLFKLDITDYKGWAKGLKKAGYATAPSYANLLISIIEDYELYKYDNEKKSGSKKKEEIKINPHDVYIANELLYVIARQGDTFKGIGKEFKIGWRKLIKYNDLHNGYTLADKDIVYLQKKNKKANEKHSVHVVREGDSMHTISQIYGIRLKDLYKMNKKDGEYIPEVGDCLKVR